MGNKAGAFKRTLTFTCDSSNPQGKRNNREEVEADFSIMGCDEIKVSVGPGLPMNSSKFKTVQFFKSVSTFHLDNSYLPSRVLLEIFSSLRFYAKLHTNVSKALHKNAPSDTFKQSTKSNRRA